MEGKRKGKEEKREKQKLPLQKKHGRWGSGTGDREICLPWQKREVENGQGLSPKGTGHQGDRPGQHITEFIKGKTISGSQPCQKVLG